jgi:hypothetical protein
MEPEEDGAFWADELVIPDDSEGQVHLGRMQKFRDHRDPLALGSPNNLKISVSKGELLEAEPTPS